MRSGRRPFSILRSKTTSGACAWARSAPANASAATIAMRIINLDIVRVKPAVAMPGGHWQIGSVILRLGADGAGSLGWRNLDLGQAVEGPGGFVGRRDGRGIGERVPREPSERIAEATDWVPGTVRRRCDPKLQPAVPREILELHGA